jgi:adenosylcobinamide-GDP ribazoletransferase
VGAVVGGLGALAFEALRLWEISPAPRAVLMTLFYLGVTGGLHMDGFMDACDAVFSRRDREARLGILSDTHVGAFAVMGCASVLMLKAGIFSELFSAQKTFPFSPFSSFFPLPALASISVFSRLGLAAFMYLPFAKEDGLARSLGSARVITDRFVIWAAYALCAAALAVLGLRWLLVPLAGAVFLCLYGRYCVKNFGGITGDLLGASLELSETIMLCALLAAR